MSDNYSIKREIEYEQKANEHTLKNKLSSSLL